MTIRTQTQRTTKTTLYGQALANLPWRQLAKDAGIAVVFVLFTVVLVQALYPRSMALPNTKIAGQAFGFKDREHIASSLNQLNTKPFQLRAGNDLLAYSAEETGITIDGSKDAEAVLQYSWAERLVPFSLFFEKRDDQFISYQLDEAKAQQFARSLSQHNKLPRNAVVKLKGTDVSVAMSEAGYAYDATAAFEAMKQLKLTPQKNLALNPEVTEPAMTDAMALAAAETLKERLSVPLTVEAAGHTKTFSTKTLADWTVIKAGKKEYKLTYDRKKVAAALKSLAADVYVAPISAQTKYHDGVAVKTSGKTKLGRALHTDKSVTEVLAAARTNKPEIQLPTVAVQPQNHAVRTYSRTSKGIQALLNYWASTHSGQYGIFMRQLNGPITASYQPDKQFFTASVYKNYVAYVVYTKVLAKQLSLQGDAGNGQTIEACLEVMIVRSDNSCGESLGAKIGWGANNAMLQNKGFGSTNLSTLQTTARDTATFMRMVQTGTLTNSKYDNVLLNMFGRQIWRSGIPAGSAGMHVANKIGAAGGYNNDVAIVYHPKGAYVLTVLSSGSGFGNISNLAAEIAAVMSQ